MSGRVLNRDCELNAEIARDVLRAQFPELAPHDVQHAGAGFDHDAFEINGEWIVRMPMRAEIAARLPIELGALELAAEVLELAVPRIALRGVPSARYPYAFTGYRKLPGVCARELPSEAFCSEHNARVLGRAFGALHRVPAERAHAHGVLPASAAQHSAQDRAARVLSNRPEIDAAVGPERARRYTDFLAERPLIAADAGARVLRHDDLHLEHILLDPRSGQVSGLIDWTDANTGDPASEFALLYQSCGEPFVLRVLASYDGPADAGLLERIRVRARWALLGWIAGAMRDDRSAIPRCLAYFDHVFPS